VGGHQRRRHRTGDPHSRNWHVTCTRQRGAFSCGPQEHARGAHAGYQGELTEYKRLQEDRKAYRNGPETLTAKDAPLNEDIVAGRYAVGSVLFGPYEVTFPGEADRGRDVDAATG